MTEWTKNISRYCPFKELYVIYCVFFILRRPPADDGGTAIKHYVVDLLDTTTNNMWTTVAMSNTGEDRQLIIRYIFPPPLQMKAR